MIKGKLIQILFLLTFATFLLSCVSIEERERRRLAEEQRRQWILEGRNPRTGLFDEQYSGKSFQEQVDLDEFKLTAEYQRAFENHQRFQIRFAENQAQIDEQNLQIEARNAEINRRNAEINRSNQERDRAIREFQNSANRQFENWRETNLRRFNLWPDPNKAFSDSGRSGSAYFEMKPINRMGFVTDGFIATGRIEINRQVVFNDILHIKPPSFPPRLETERRLSSVQNTMIYNPNTIY